MDWHTFTPNDEPADYIGGLNQHKDNGQALEAEIVAARDGSETLAARLSSMTGGTSAVATEVANARAGYENLAAKLLAMVNATTAAQTTGNNAVAELVDARSTFPSLAAHLAEITVELGAVIDEVTDARGTEPTLAAQLAAIVVDLLAALVAKSGLDADLSAGGHRITDLENGVDPQDAATVAQVAAGGSPGDIPITDLGLGTLTDGQVLRRVGAGLAGTSVPIVPRIAAATGAIVRGELVIGDVSAAAHAQTLDAPAAGARAIVHCYGNGTNNLLSLTPAATTQIRGPFGVVTDADTLDLRDGETVHLAALDATTWEII